MHAGVPPLPQPAVQRDGQHPRHPQDDGEAGGTGPAREEPRPGRVVGPLFAGQALTTLWLLAARPAGTALLPVLAGAACLAVVLGVTAVLAVPLHRRLGEGWDADAHRRLLHADTARAVAATAGTLVAGWLLLG